MYRRQQIVSFSLNRLCASPSTWVCGFKQWPWHCAAGVIVWGLFYNHWRAWDSNIYTYELRPIEMRSFPMFHSNDRGVSQKCPCVFVIFHTAGEWRKSNDPAFVITACVSEILRWWILGWNILLPSLWQQQKKKKSHASVSNKLAITQQQNPSPSSIPRFHAIPLQALLLATLDARPKQFSNKLFAFIGIHFQLFLHSPFVVGSDCLSEFPYSLRD